MKRPSEAEAGFLSLELPDDIEILKRIEISYRESIKSAIKENNLDKYYAAHENLQKVRRKIRRLQNE